MRSDDRLAEGFHEMAKDWGLWNTSRRDLRSREIAQICSRFEEAFREAQAPSLEEFLGILPAGTGMQRELLVELIGIDIEWRWRKDAERKAELAKAKDLRCCGNDESSGMENRLVWLTTWPDSLPLAHSKNCLCSSWAKSTGFGTAGVKSRNT